MPDTRELVVTRFPYPIVYEVETGAGAPMVIILRVLHGRCRRLNRIDIP
jgi:plasmid stabilization system protein ParE